MATEAQWILTTVLCVSVARFSAAASVNPLKVHEHATSDEALYERNVHRTRRSILPQVNFANLNLNTFYLEPADHLLLGWNTPIYLASGDKSQPLGIRYERVQKAWPSSLKMYRDLANEAAATAFERLDRRVYSDETIGNDLKSLPSRLSNHKYISRSTYSPASEPRRRFRLGMRPRHTPPPRVKVDAVYPEILVIVDHSTYLAHGKSLQALSGYMAAFWNAVDLRFRAMNEPKVRLNIAGLIVAVDKGGAVYVTKHRLGKQYLPDEETLNEVGEYLHREERFGRDTYDFAVAITNLDLCWAMPDGCKTSTVGLAAVGGACKNHSNVAVVEDHGSFDGVLVAAHEIAHLLGARHDGENSNFGPGAASCDGDGGFLLGSSQQSSSNVFLWSECSVHQMQYFTRNAGECLRNKPVVEKSIIKMLPGQIMSRDEQCRIMLGMVECKGHGGNECGELWCRKPSAKSNRKCVNIWPPAEGSPCSGKGVCLDGKCVGKKEEDKVMTEKPMNDGVNLKRSVLQKTESTPKPSYHGCPILRSLLIFLQQLLSCKK